MGKTANCIKMLHLLKSRQKMSREELAFELNTNKRNIIVYKNELSEAGYLIDSTPGVGGGYYLVSGPLLPNLRFSEKEQSAIEESQLFLKNQSSFIRYDDYQSAMDKIKGTFNLQETVEQIYVGRRPIVDEKLIEWIDTASIATKNYHALEITYQTLKEDRASTFVIHPYRVMVHKEAYYCLAYSLKRKQFRIYRFSRERMKECKMLDKKFNPDPDFKVSDYIGQLNFMKDQIYEIKVSVHNEAAIRIAEREVGIEIEKVWNQDVLELHTIMEGEVDTISFLLSLGKDVVVHEPKQIKELMRKQVQAMAEHYSR